MNPDRVVIAELSARAEHSDRVLGWLRRTWDDPDNVFARTLTPAKGRPGALVAIVGDTPCGVLTFRRYQSNSHSQVELWINAVYVSAGHRRRGIASRLIRAAVEHSIPKHATRIFVFTEFPQLYEAIGWKRIDYDEESASYSLRIEQRALAAQPFGELEGTRGLPSRGSHRDVTRDSTD